MQPKHAPAAVKPLPPSKKLTDKEKRLTVRNALMLEVNRLTNAIREEENKLRPMKLKLTYLRGELLKISKTIGPVAQPMKKLVPKKKPVAKKPAAKKAPPAKKGPSKADVEKAAKILKKQLESPAFAEKLKEVVAERDAIDVTPKAQA